MNDAAVFLDSLARIVGAANVVVDPELVAPYLEEPRGLFRGDRKSTRLNSSH